MFVVGRPWIQVISFMLQNLLSLAFLLSVKPYEKASNNYLNIFNELVSLLISYLIVQISDLKYKPEILEKIGEYIVNTIYISWGVNFCIIVTIILLELK